VPSQALVSLLPEYRGTVPYEYQSFSAFTGFGLSATKPHVVDPRAAWRGLQIGFSAFTGFGLSATDPQVWPTEFGYQRFSAFTGFGLSATGIPDPPSYYREETMEGFSAFTGFGLSATEAALWLIEEEEEEFQCLHRLWSLCYALVPA